MGNFLIRFLLIVNVGLIITLGFKIGTIFILSITLICLLNNYLLMYSQRRKGSEFIKFLLKWVRFGIYALIISFFCIESLIQLEIFKTQNISHEDLAKCKYMIILGAGLDGEYISKRLEQRLKKALLYLKKDKNIPIIVSGGQGNDELISEAEAMKKYLKLKGIQSERIICEKKSTSTIENIKYSLKKMKSLKNALEPVIIVTSDYHIFRARMIANEIGLNNYGISSKSHIIERFNYMIREYVVILKDWLLFRLNYQ